MQMEDAKDKLVRLGRSMGEAFPANPEARVVFPSGFGLLSLTCDVLLDEMKRRHNPYVEVSN